MKLAMHRKPSGFSLVEMAVVLVIVALLLGGLLPSVFSQTEQQRFNETRRYLDEIRNALIGYAQIYGTLPCPATSVYGAANYGVADSTCTNPVSNNYLPWKTLGVNETDSWGGKWLYRVDPAFASSVPFTLSTATSTTLQIQDSAGNVITSSTGRPIAIVFSTGKDLVANGQNGGSFDAIYQSDVPSPGSDDIMVWISRPRLFYRMVAAGKLP